MPNRIIREGILTSLRVATLNWTEEVFYRRLMSVVDDFGRYHAHPKLLRAACYPLLLDKVSDADIEKWLSSCTKAALVSVYPAPDGKRYLQMLDFRQQTRAVASKYPPMTVECVADAKQTISEGVAPAHLDGDGDVYVDDIKTLSGKPDGEAIETESFNGHNHDKPTAKEATQREKNATAVRVISFLNEKAGKNFGTERANVQLVVGRLNEGATEQDFRSVIALKTRQWKGEPKTREWLCPKTLFNATNFAQYKGSLGRDEEENENAVPGM